MAYNEVELKAMRKEFAPTATDDQWTLFISQCERRQLEPGRHVIFGTRDSSKFDKDTQQWITEAKVTLITTVEALKLLAERTGKLKGIRPVIFYYNQAEGDGFKESKIPLGRICHAASVEILRSDWTEPGFGIARYDACVQRKKAKAGQTVGDPNSVWDKRGEEMTGKCAKADAFRNTFFEECGGLYIDEELHGSETVPEKGTGVPETVTPQPIAVQQPVIPATLQVNQAPAAVVEDARKVEPGTSEAAAEVEAPAVPVVTEQTISNLHNEGAKLDGAAPVADDDPEPLPEGLFPSVDTLFGEVAPPVLSQAPPPPPAPVTPPPAAPAPVEAPANAGNPDDLPPGTSSPAFKAFTARCTTIVRDTLPKAGEKNGSVLLTQYIAAKTGKSKLGDVTSAQWKALLEVLEKAGNPQKTLALIKAK